MTTPYEPDYNNITTANYPTSSSLDATYDNEIQSVFESLLSIAASSNNLTQYQNVLASGGSVSTVRSDVAYSAGVKSDLNAIYEAAVGRAIDPSGLANLQAQLAAGSSLSAVRSEIAYGPEASGDINAIYEAELGRAADPGGLAGYQQYLANGGNLAAIRSAGAYSAEASGDINAIYQAELGRAADPGGLAACQQALASGGSLTAIRYNGAYSAEAVSDINAIYEAELGRAADSGGLAACQQALASGGSLTTIRYNGAYSAEAASDITGVLNGLDVSGAAQAGDLGQAQAALSSGLTLASAVSKLISSSGILNGVVIQIDQDLNRTAAAIVADEQTLQQAVLSDFQAIGSALVNSSTISGHVSNDIMTFIANQFANEPPNPTSLTPAQTATLATIVQSAVRSGTDAAPAGATLINGSPLLTAFCSVFDPSQSTYHSYDVEYAINNGSNTVSQQVADQDLARVAVPGNIFNAPLANGAISTVSAYLGTYVGRVTTFIEPGSNTAINYTLDGHLFDTGVVGLTISEASGQTIVQVHGCGQNTDPQLAALNQYAGPQFAFRGVAQNLQNLINPSGTFTIVHQ